MSFMFELEYRFPCNSRVSKHFEYQSKKKEVQSAAMVASVQFSDSGSI